MQSYYKTPKLPAEVLSEDAWFRTANIGYVDKDNYFHHRTARKTC